MSGRSCTDIRMSPFPFFSHVQPTQYDETLVQASLVEMNNLLQVLAEIFPEHQVSLLRRLLLDASPESRLATAANSLIQHPEWHAHLATRVPSATFEEWEKYRPTKYRVTVEKLLYASSSHL